MNIIFSFIIIVGSTLLIFKDPNLLLKSMLDGGGSAITFSLKLIVIYAVWLSILKLCEATKLDKKIAKVVSKITNKLFKGENQTSLNYINLNLATNFLGMGGAATPLGIKAVENMTHKKNTILLIIINATSIQLLPTTIISMRADLNATQDIVLASIICTAINTIIGIILVKVFVK